MDFEEEEEEELMNNQNRRQVIEESNGIMNVCEDSHNKNRPHGTSNNKAKNATKLTVQDNHNNINEEQTGNGQQDEWEEFENSNPKYDQLRLKFLRGTNDQIGSGDDEDDHDDDDYDDGHNTNNHGLNSNDHTNNIGGDNDEQSSRNNRRREQQKDKPVWKLDQVKQTEPTENIETENALKDKVVEVQPPKSATSDVYRPPQLRGNSSVTIVSGVNPRMSKKEKPNIASTEDFPSLGAALNRK